MVGADEIYVIENYNEKQYWWRMEGTRGRSAAGRGMCSSPARGDAPSRMCYVDRMTTYQIVRHGRLPSLPGFMLVTVGPEGDRMATIVYQTEAEAKEAVAALERPEVPSLPM